MRSDFPAACGVDAGADEAVTDRCDVGKLAV
jgi:hypothetical protein